MWSLHHGSQSLLSQSGIEEREVLGSETSSLQDSGVMSGQVEKGKAPQRERQEAGNQRLLRGSREQCLGLVGERGPQKPGAEGREASFRV